MAELTLGEIVDTGLIFAHRRRKYVELMGTMNNVWESVSDHGDVGI
jgi:hypothetical protein